MNNRKRNLLICLYLVSMTGIVSHAQDQNIASLIQQLEHTDVAVQNRARQSLVEIGEAAVPALIEALSDHDRVSRKNATRVLARIGLPAVPALIAALDHENVIVRRKVVDSLHTMKTHPPHKNIVRGLIKALKDEDPEVRHKAMGSFISIGESAPEAIPGLVRLLYYGSLVFSPDTAHLLLMRMGDRGRVALTEALHNSQWSLRFGAAIAYGYAWTYKYNKLSSDVGPLPEAVVPMLAEGLTHPDEETREEAALILMRLSDCRIDDARKALEAFPPFALVSGTIKDGDTVVDLDSLNTGGITFKFNHLIQGGRITIKPVGGEPLGWKSQRRRHSVTITPQTGKELVRGKVYMIQLRDFKDVVWNRVDTDITFTTKQ